MSAIITEDFRRNNVKRFLDDISSETYHVGIGRSNPWQSTGGLSEDDFGYNVEQAFGTFSDNLEVLNNLTTLIGFTSSNASHVIPNIPAKTNHRHKAFNPFDPDCFYQTTVNSILMFPCYVVVNNAVYLCLRSPTATSGDFNFPTGSGMNRIPFVLGDDSVWVYLYTVASEFPINVSQFITVPSVPTQIGTEADDAASLAAIETATANLVYGFSILNPGAGYSSTPTAQFIPFDDPGNPITLDVTLTSTAITSVRYQSGIINTLASWPRKKGYVKITGGGSPTTHAIVRPNIASDFGFGANPVDDLPSWYAGIALDAVENIFGDGAFIPYRQISIIRNAAANVGVVDPELSMNCLEYIQFDSDGAPSPSLPVLGEVVRQTGSLAQGICDYYDGDTRRLYFHQTYDTGFTSFNDTQSITIGAAADEYTPEEIGEAEYVKETGEVLFVENRSKITRSGGQTEEQTIILQF
jgi:hypothetical protein